MCSRPTSACPVSSRSGNPFGHRFHQPLQRWLPASLLGRLTLVMVAGVLVTQSLPFADPKVLALLAAYERAAYAL